MTNYSSNPTQHLLEKLSEENTKEKNLVIIKKWFKHRLEEIDNTLCDAIGDISYCNVYATAETASEYRCLLSDLYDELEIINKYL